MDDAIGDALKTLDVDHLQDAGRLAHERDPEKYPYTHLTSLTTSNYVAGNPLYDILHDGRTSFEGPPLFSLSSIPRAVYITRNTALTEWHVDMPALTNVSESFVSSPVTVFDGALPNLQNGTGMFFDSDLASWDTELPSLVVGQAMFRGTKLTEWHIDLPNLTDATYMFYGAAPLRSFKGDLSALETLNRMFLTCRQFDLFETTNLDRLRNAEGMFYYTAGLAVFDYDLPALTHGVAMFYGAPKTKRFSSKVPLLENGKSMFYRCGMTSFQTALPSLTNGDGMFSFCKLDLSSVQTIARTIKDNNEMATPPTLTLGMAKALQGQVDAELDLIRAKGWALTAQYN